MLYKDQYKKEIRKLIEINNKAIKLIDEVKENTYYLLEFKQGGTTNFAVIQVYSIEVGEMFLRFYAAETLGYGMEDKLQRSKNENFFSDWVKYHNIESLKKFKKEDAPLLVNSKYISPRIKREFFKA